MNKTLGAAILICIGLLGCGRERIVEKNPDGHPKIIRTYTWFGEETQEHLKREQTFHFNNHKHTDTRFKNGLRHGPYRDFTMNGQKKSEGQFVRGQKEGEWIFYYNQFTVSAKGSFSNNLKQGIWEQFWENGDPKARGNFKEGKEIDTLKEWSSKGDLILENSCFEGNDRGQYRTFHGSQILKEEYACRHGIPSGGYTKLDPDGMTVEKGQFDSLGRKQGLWESFHPDGKKASHKQYLAGLENDSAFTWDLAGRIKEKGVFQSGAGELVGYDSLGHLIEKQSFAHGHPEGEAWTFYQNGKQKSRVLYKDGKPLELQKWYAHGKPMALGFYKEGKRSGVWKIFGENGKLKEASEYQNGTLHGQQLFYGPEGQLVRSLRYEHGYPAEGRIPANLAAELNIPFKNRKNPSSASDSTHHAPPH